MLTIVELLLTCRLCLNDLVLIDFRVRPPGTGVNILLLPFIVLMQPSMLSILALMSAIAVTVIGAHARREGKVGDTCAIIDVVTALDCKGTHGGTAIAGNADTGGETGFAVQPQGSPKAPQMSPSCSD